MNKFNAIAFDYGNTLLSTNIDWNYVLPMRKEKFIKSLIQNFDNKIKKEIAEKIFEKFMFLRNDNEKTADKSQIDELASLTLKKAIKDVNSDSKIFAQISESKLINIVDSYFETEGNLFPMFPNTKETLLKLKEKNIKLVLLTNNTWPRLIESTLERFDILKLFDFKVHSVNYKRKPSIEIFKPFINFAKENNVDTNKLAMVGDSPYHDVFGAKQSGITPFLCKFTELSVKQPIDQNNDDVIAIKNISELLNYI